VIELILRLVALFFRVLPERAALNLGRGLGLLAYALIRSRRAVALDNLRRAFGDQPEEAALRRLCRENFAHYGVVLAEFLRLPGLSTNDLHERFTVTGLERATAARAKGRGLIILTGHVGNWEYLIQAQLAWDLDMIVVTRRAHAKGVDRFWQNVRRVRGACFLDAHRSLKETRRHLRNGGAVGLSIDQHEGGTTGVRVPFFGRDAGTVKAPALLAARTGCPVVMLLSWRDEQGRHHASFSEEIPLDHGRDLDETIARTTRRYNELLEQFIREHPTQWTWVHKRWKSA
jgi:Kdo2-lipid IVA lauroyltransferase/acyltransferase